MSARTARRHPDALGTVEQLPSGRYRASYRADGRKYTGPHTFDTKAEARAWLAGERADRARGVWVDPERGRQTLAEYAADYLGTRGDLSPQSLAQYQALVRRLIAVDVTAESGKRINLGVLPLADITPARVRTWHAAVLHTAKLSAARPGRKIEPGSPVRAYARKHGIPCKPTGRPPAVAVAAWETAGRPMPDAQRRAPARRAEKPGRAIAVHAYRVLRLIMNAAVNDGEVSANPCKVRGAGEDSDTERPTATPSEVAALAAAMPVRLAAAVTLAAWSGLRWGELFALAREHVDLQAGTVRVERALVRDGNGGVEFSTPKTKRSRRTVALPAFVVVALTAHMAEHVPAAPDALLFATAAGTPYTNARISVLFAKARTVIGRPELHWHDLRHTAAMLAYQADTSVPDVQQMLGHTTMRAAAIYAHAADDSGRARAERMNALFAAAADVPHLRPVPA